MFIWTVSNCGCYLIRQLKLWLPFPHPLHLLFPTALFPSILSLSSFFPWDSFTVQITIWSLKHSPLNFKQKVIELGQWWEDQRRGLLDESPGETPAMPKSRPPGSCSLRGNPETGGLRGCTWICGVQEHSTLSAVQGWRSRDLKARIRKSLLLITYRAGQVLQKIPWSHDLACL